MPEDEVNEVEDIQETQETGETQGVEGEGQETQETGEAQETPAPTIEQLQAELQKATSELEHHRRVQGETQKLREWANQHFGGVPNMIQQMGNIPPAQPDGDTFYDRVLSDPQNMNAYVDQRAAIAAQQIVANFMFEQQRRVAEDKVVSMLQNSGLDFNRQQEIYTIAYQMPTLQAAVDYVESTLKAAVGPKVAAETIQNTTNQVVELANQNAEARHAKLRTQAQPKTTTGGGPGGGPGPGGSVEEQFKKELFDAMKTRTELDRALDAE